MHTSCTSSKTFPEAYSWMSVVFRSSSCLHYKEIVTLAYAFLDQRAMFPSRHKSLLSLFHFLPTTIHYLQLSPFDSWLLEHAARRRCIHEFTLKQWLQDSSCSYFFPRYYQVKNHESLHCCSYFHQIFLFILTFFLSPVLPDLCYCQFLSVDCCIPISLGCYDGHYYVCTGFLSLFNQWVSRKQFSASLPFSCVRKHRNRKHDPESQDEREMQIEGVTSASRHWKGR